MAEAGPQRAESSGPNLARYALLLLLLVAGAAGLAFAGTASLVERTTASGLRYQIITEGSGEHPTVADTVAVHYVGRLPDGKVFDSSYTTGQPAQFPLAGVIPGWTEGVQLMRPGGKARFVIPARLAYGEKGAGGVIPPNTDLTFDIELLAIAPRQ